MINAKRFAALFLLSALGSAPLVIAQAGYSQRAKEIGMHLKCQCRGCDMTVTGCSHPGGAFTGPCLVPQVGATAMLKEIDQHLAKGETEQQIIDAFVAEYGSTVYVEPPKKGFGLVAWAMPIVYSIVGFAFVIFIVRKWAVRPPSAASTSPAAPSDVLERAKAQAARETED